jgi:hypothetical protein
MLTGYFWYAMFKTQNKIKGGKMNKQKIPVVALFFILGLFSLSFSDEQLTITTYYPSPYGSYQELTSYRMKIGTTYSGSSFTVNNNDLLIEGNVGIGTTPLGKLHVALPNWNNRTNDSQHVIFGSGFGNNDGMRLGYNTDYLYVGLRAFGVIDVLDPGGAWGNLILQDQEGGGSVGIGTTQPHPSSKLQVRGRIQAGVYGGEEGQTAYMGPVRVGPYPPAGQEKKGDIAFGNQGFLGYDGTKWVSLQAGGSDVMTHPCSFLFGTSCTVGCDTANNEVPLACVVNPPNNGWYNWGWGAPWYWNQANCTCFGYRGAGTCTAVCIKTQ